MKAPVKATALLFSVVLVLGSFGLVSGQAVFVDVSEIQGLVDGEIPYPGGDLVIPVRFVNGEPNVTCISNGYNFLSDNLTYTEISAEWNPAYCWGLSEECLPPEDEVFFDLGTFIRYFDNGVGVAALTGQYGTGLPVDFDDVAYFITLRGVQGNAGEVLTMDSTWWEPANIWVWCGDDPIYPSWGGPYELRMCCGPITWCTPQPTILKESDPLLEVYFRGVDTDDVILESILIQGNIPPYEGYPIVEHDEIRTACMVTRFLGSSGFRPIPPEGVQTTYTVDFDMIDGSHYSLIGDYVLETFQGDVTLDGKADLADLQFMADYFWGDGSKCEYEEFMDVDGNGQLDVRDAMKLMDVVEM